MYCTSKIVVFDLDETLGYYVEFGMFWDALQDYIKKHNIPIAADQELFNKVLDLYPEFLRPNIINILNYLKKKKMSKHCNKLMIYTNNQGPNEWAQHIQSYFETKLNYKLFDQIIKAFKIGEKQVELYRTSHMKKHDDLIRCTKIPETTEICFLDDAFHPGMIDERVYYINLKPYIYDLPFETMVDRFIKSGIMNTTLNISESLINYMKKYRYSYVEKTKEAQNVDKILSKKIFQHLQTFFTKPPNKMSHAKTNKSLSKNNNKTRKNKLK
jgi:hypothetical protein